MKTMYTETRSPAFGADASLTSDALAWTGALDAATLARRHLQMVLTALAFGLLAALWMRLELMTPALDQLDATAYGALLSLHGSLMMYFVALPLFPGVLGLALLERVTGRRDPVFPRLVRASWQLLGLGLLLLVLGFIGGGTEAGWSFDAEFGGRFTHGGIVWLAAGAGCAAGSAILLAVNLLAGVGIGRPASRLHAGLRATRVAWLGGGIAGLVTGGALAACSTLVLLDRLAGISFFCNASGCNPADFARLFRFVATPIQSLQILFALGTLLLAASARPWRGSLAERLLPGAIAFATVAGLWAWPGPSSGGADAAPPAMIGSTLLSAPLFAAVLLAVLVALRNLFRAGAGWGAEPHFLAGGLSLGIPALAFGVALAPPFAGAFLSGTLFATAQAHLLFAAFPGLVFLAGLHGAWPGLTGRHCPPAWSRAAAMVTTTGAVTAFLPLFVLGLRGAPFRANAYVPEFQTLQVLATAGSTLFAAGIILTVATFLLARPNPENRT